MGRVNLHEPCGTQLPEINSSFYSINKTTWSVANMVDTDFRPLGFFKGLFKDNSAIFKGLFSSGSYTNFVQLGPQNTEIILKHIVSYLT